MSVEFDEKDVDLENDKEYSQHYSEDNFWDKVMSVAKKAGLTTIAYALALYYVLKANFVDFKAKAIIVAALGYFIFPIDIIPDILPFVGYTDDVIVLLTALKVVRDEINEDIIEKVTKKLKEWFGVTREEVESLLMKNISKK